MFAVDWCGGERDTHTATRSATYTASNIVTRTATQSADVAADRPQDKRTDEMEKWNKRTATHTATCTAIYTATHRPITRQTDLWDGKKDCGAEREELKAEGRVQLQQKKAARNTLHHTAAHSNTLQQTATRGNTRQHTAMHGYAQQHAAPHCSTLPHTATDCSTLQHVLHACEVGWRAWRGGWRDVRCSELDMCCSASSHVSHDMQQHMSALRHVLLHSSYCMSRIAATHVSLQRTHVLQRVMCALQRVLQSVFQCAVQLPGKCMPDIYTCIRWEVGLNSLLTRRRSLMYTVHVLQRVCCSVLARRASWRDGGGCLVIF